MSILVLAEHEHGTFKKTASELGTTVDAVVLGGGADAASLGAYGASKAYVVDGDFSNYDGDTLTAALAAAIEAASPSVVLTAAGYLAADALPRLVAKLDSGMGTECVALRVEGGTVVGRRADYSGKVLCDVAVSGSPAFFSVRPNSFGQPEAGGGSAEVVSVSFEAPAARLTLTKRETPEQDAVDLTEADRIVSGGRSLKSAENFDSVIRPLAKSIGATAGAIGDNTGHQGVIATAGALLGAAVGHDVAHQRSATTRYVTEQRCETSYELRDREEVVGYRVSYEYAGGIYHTRTRHRPGPTIEVGVILEPVVN